MEKILIIWAVLNAAALFMLVMVGIEAVDYSFFNPKGIYNNMKVNWFGAWLLAIVYNIILPTIAIPYWIYKLCTVGR